MICPQKLCKQEIPDDSLYCDQCGIQILRCSKCGNSGISKFCGKCGGAMVFKEIDAPDPKPIPEPPQQTVPKPVMETPSKPVPETPPQIVPQPIPEPPQQAVPTPVTETPPETVSKPASEPPVQTVPKPAAPQAQAASSATIIVQAATKKLLFCHSDGWNMEIADGDILGRTSGNHTNCLGAIPVISGTHAKITQENGVWYITDQKSTNKTYIGGIAAQPGVPVQLKNNDVVQLANVKFTVRES